MAYADFQGAQEYFGTGTGSEYAIVMVNEDNPREKFTGFSGLSVAEEFEKVPVEEAGNDGVDEFGDGRHTVSANLNGFWRPEYNDNFFPTRQTFHGKRWTLFRKRGVTRTNPGITVDTLTGVVINNFSTQEGARGNITFSMSILASRRYNGAQWAAIAPTP